MRILPKSIFFCGISFILLSASFSCKKDGYLTDGGVSQAITPLSNYDYLEGNPNHLFDTTILLIDHFNLKDSVNKAGTFFAFTDISVNILMHQLGVSSINQFYDSVTSKFLTQYMFTDSITLSAAGTNPVQYPNWAGDSALSAVSKIESSYVVYLTNSNPAYNYFTLQYIKINGVLDGSVNAPPDDPLDYTTTCQTTGIKTSSGATLLHVLANNTILNKL